MQRMRLLVTRRQGWRMWAGMEVDLLHCGRSFSTCAKLRGAGNKMSRLIMRISEYEMKTIKFCQLHSLLHFMPRGLAIMHLTKSLL